MQGGNLDYFPELPAVGNDEKVDASTVLGRLRAFQNSLSYLNSSLRDSAEHITRTIGKDK